jgi:anti-sigma regulatory factor (Ser/Thr protein kinase)
MTGNAGRRELPGDMPPGGDLLDSDPVLDQVFDADSLHALRAAVAAHCMQAGLAEGRVGDLVLAVHELAANAVRHGAGHGRLRVWNTGGTLRCEVTDDGAPSPVSLDGEAPAAPGSARWNIEPGHGLWVVRQVADQTSLHGGSSGTVAEVSFRLGPQRQHTFPPSRTWPPG